MTGARLECVPNVSEGRDTGRLRLLAMIDELGAGPNSAAKARELSEAIRLASLCGLGQAAPLALLAALESFPADFGL